MTTTEFAPLTEIPPGFELPPMEQAAEALAEGARERAFWNEHCEEFKRLYPDQFVVVRGGEVVAAAADLVELERFLEATEIAPGRPWLKFFHSEQPLWLL